MLGTDQDVPYAGKRCPTCGMAVRIIRREDGSADHYEHLQPVEIDEFLLPQDPTTAERLRQLRAGKKTVALVGMASTSCSFAPFNDDGVEIWCLNEMHEFPWMLKWDRWFQIHSSKYFKRDIAKRGVEGHYDWLQKKHDRPIYMQFRHDEIPDSVEYPLIDITEEFFSIMWKGEFKFKYLTSTFALEMALAIYKGFARIEIYGFDMSPDEEWENQKSCAEFWLGVANGRGIEIYLPPNNQLLEGKLYGYQGLKKGGE